MSTSAAHWPAAAASAARRRSRATSSSTCRPTARSTARSCASAPRRTPSRSTRVVRLALCRGRASRTCTTPPSDFRRLQEALARAVADRERHRRPPGAVRRCRRRCAQGDWTVTAAVRGQRRREIVGALAGLRTSGPTALAVDIGSTTIAAHLCDLVTRRGARLRRADEPADPLRRGPDEPGLLRHDEPGRRPGD